ncbi:phage tail protein [Weissella paramesenteroides]|uniref:phage tail protein n=1 Tax=Weissella paramesenteroides TaxID=1249 RepID=UPI0020741C68|nr:phage tail protein [Weissella paramesenteroides]MCM6766457.1 phage tail protein [Weissella paramesenteroides]MCM6768325.1 phage tail protein [Weissella paramesenteroides]MCM6771839.1 phage tail protein [Weissella paramesenteroides]MCM6780982.1 phage tail protein [Weissella paramesenteroides]MCM6782864.1 phage tail protein [Weissella paramesenteroides]
MANIIYAYTTNLDEVPVIVTGLSITETINELSTLSFSFTADGRNKIAAVAMIPQTRVLVPETGQWFRLSNVNPISSGDVRTYQVSAVHVGIDLHDKYVENKLTNTQSLDQCMKLITDGTSFNYVIHDSFSNYSFSDGFGADYADSLLMNNLKDNFGFEFYLDNWTIHIYKMLGKTDQFIFIDGYNASKIQWTEDYSNIRTKIKGIGKQNDDGTYAATAEYNSPAQTIWGVKQAATIQDDRFTDNNSLLNYIKSQLQDYPIVQYTMERAEFEHHAKLSDINQVVIGNSGLIKDRLGVEVDVRIIGKTFYPQDAKQNDTVTFGNKLFDYAHNYAALQKARNSNESLGKTLSKIQENVTSIIDSNNNRKMWKIGVVKE